MACGPAQPGNNFSRRAPRSVVTGNYLQNNLSSRGATLLPAPSSPLPIAAHEGACAPSLLLCPRLGLIATAFIWLNPVGFAGGHIASRFPSGHRQRKWDQGQHDQAIAATSSDQARAFRVVVAGQQLSRQDARAGSGRTGILRSGQLQLSGRRPHRRSRNRPRQRRVGNFRSHQHRSLRGGRRRHSGADQQWSEDARPTQDTQSAHGGSGKLRWTRHNIVFELVFFSSATCLSVNRRTS